MMTFRLDRAAGHAWGWNPIEGEEVLHAMDKESVLQPAVPVLRICDVAKAKEFYLDFLGLTLDWEGIGATLVAVGVALVGGPDR